MRPDRAAAEPAGTPVAWPFRAWLWVEVLFGVAAISSLVLHPADTATRFAWPIQPVVTAAVLGSLYLATTPLLVLAALARRWEMIRVIVLPAVAFTTAELVATLLHLEKFRTGTAPFNVWFASYVLPPLVFVAMYVVQQRRVRAGSPAQTADRPLPPRLRAAMALVGAFLSVDAVVGFVWPGWFTGSFPWTLTPLTARVLCGWLIAVGTLMVSMARENDRDRVRVGLPQLILVLPLVALQVGRFSEQVDLGHPRLWIGAALFAFTAAAGLLLSAGSWRRALR